MMDDKRLTGRQIEILAALSMFKTMQSAATYLRLSSNTVRNHLAAMRAKTGMSNVELIRAYHQEIAGVANMPEPRSPRQVRYYVDTEWANRQREAARLGMQKLRRIRAEERAARYAELIVEQAGRCAICGKAEDTQVLRNGKVRRLAVDHDHNNMTLRGLLCLRCNVMLGNAGDDPTQLEKGARYLRKWMQHNTKEGVA